MLVSHTHTAAGETEFNLLMSAAERLPSVGSCCTWPFQGLGNFGLNLHIVQIRKIYNIASIMLQHCEQQ